ncbi:ATP-dependent DNA helicase RecG [Alkalibacter mobilis]|uniref:ATP-dependent DNA helicase RecG n=1 Tax=Alkalibacter mobilis TaxID=2787712 RepID=UPI0018A111DE|nr:ATP-dependent DNA helicase RecG [Alkalibacter mobilis]MBF7095847.1 ATP-dependent DNA helicase RecG [Alkalibacter mobilis]
MNKYESIKSLKGIGEKKETLFHKVGIFNIRDLINYFPWDYERRVLIENSDELTEGEKFVVKGTISSLPLEKRIRNNLKIIKFACRGSIGNFDVIWYNMPYVKNSIKKGNEYYFYGKINRKFGVITIESPDFNKDIGQIVFSEYTPKYSLTKGLGQKDFRNAVFSIFEDGYSEKEYLNTEILDEFELLQRDLALKMIHLPTCSKDILQARNRLVIDELLQVRAGFEYLKKFNVTDVKLDLTDEIIEKANRFIDSLPFKLTSGQENVIGEIYSDLKEAKRVNRLIQGDVGSGKTVVAVVLQYLFYLCGYQSVMMAPTEILATQHEKTLKKFLEPFGVRVALLKGKMKKQDKELVYKDIKNNSVDVLVGTHALIEPDLKFADLGLVITDEQHRFGVEQRKKLTAKGASPHMMVMSATPIPRTVSHVLYGDLDISTIDTLPVGRKEIKTHTLKRNKLEKLYGFLLNEVKNGRQAFIVCPEIELSDSGNFSAEDLYKELKSTYFNKINLGLVHGKMKNPEKEQAMGKFNSGEIDVLIATTVVEVGIDVPNASIMVVMDADRFGLATLHQLRGRVGRGNHESWCFLVSESDNEKTRERLKVLTESTDGFYIANKDFEMRGPGDYFGFKQHGLPDFALTDLARDLVQVKISERIFERLKEDGRTKIIENLIGSFKEKIHYLD